MTINKASVAGAWSNGRVNEVREAQGEETVLSSASH